MCIRDRPGAAVVRSFDSERVARRGRAALGFHARGYTGRYAEEIEEGGRSGRAVEAPGGVVGLRLRGEGITLALRVIVTTPWNQCFVIAVSAW